MRRQGNREAIVGDQAISDDCRGQTETPHTSCRLHSTEEQGVEERLYFSECYFHFIFDSVIILRATSFSCEGAMRNGKSRLPRQPHLSPLQTQPPPQAFNPNTCTAQHIPSFSQIPFLAQHRNLCSSHEIAHAQVSRHHYASCLSATSSPLTTAPPRTLPLIFDITSIARSAHGTTLWSHFREHGGHFGSAEWHWHWH